MIRIIFAESNPRNSLMIKPLKEKRNLNIIRMIVEPKFIDSPTSGSHQYFLSLSIKKLRTDCYRLYLHFNLEALFALETVLTVLPLEKIDLVDAYQSSAFDFVEDNSGILAARVKYVVDNVDLNASDCRLVGV
jgi:hypothetical protein